MVVVGQVSFRGFPLGPGDDGFLVSSRRVPRPLVRQTVIHRGVAQLAEHWFPKPAVAGSSPSAPALHVIDKLERCLGL